MNFQEIKRSFMISIWFIFLTFPIMVMKVNTVTKTVVWRWHNIALIGIGTFVISTVWRLALERSQRERRPDEAVHHDPSSPAGAEEPAHPIIARYRTLLAAAMRPKTKKFLIAAFVVFVVLFPFISSLYQTSIMITALIYVMLALGLNIVIGLGGMLHLGYIAFFAVGAYTYGILYRFFGVGFWVALPIGAVLSVVAGVLLALPVLRLRGDYLAIVTLGFAEIVRIVMNNWTSLSNGPQGIGGIPRPGLFGIPLNLSQVTIYIYFLIVTVVAITIFVVHRFENSRIGRALVAMGEDDIAAEAMGVDLTKTKVIAFALGSLWAGIGGVIFAARTTFINPASFTVWESIIVLSCVVLGGMGSIPGSVIGALVLILVPEYLRAFSDYRMLMFGAILVIMMVFRPGGLIQKKRKAYTFDVSTETEVVS